jgi:hypothetical protein
LRVRFRQGQVKGRILQADGSGCSQDARPVGFGGDDARILLRITSTQKIETVVRCGDGSGINVYFGQGADDGFRQGVGDVCGQGRGQGFHFKALQQKLFHRWLAFLMRPSSAMAADAAGQRRFLPPSVDSAALRRRPG